LNDFDDCELNTKGPENAGGGAASPCADNADGATQAKGKKRGAQRVKRKKKRSKKPQYTPPAVHIDNRSFLALLIRSFVSFMFITAIAVVLIFLLAMWATDKGIIDMGVRTFANYKEQLEGGKYSSIPVKRICGDDGWMCVVDSQGNFIYSSDNTERSFTLSELDCILNFDSGEVITTRSFKQPSGEYNHLILRTFTNNGETVEQYLLIDSDLRINSGSNSNFANKSQFTQSEFDLYTFNSTHDGKVIEKYYFTDGRSNGFYVIYYDTNNDEGVTPYLFVIIVVIGIICLLVISLVLYIRYINKHVQRPLKTLSTAMAEFARNDYREEKLLYSGSKEFEQLVDSFNEMATLLNASEEQRNKLEEDRQRMLAGLSHDLKTPVTIIQGFSKAIRDNLVSEEDKQKYLNLIVAKSENMGELINEFYEYSKLDHPDFKLNVNDEDVAELTRTYLASRYDEFEIRGCYLEAEIAEERLISRVDARQLKRVIDNITDNFFKYTPQGSTLFVTVRKENDDAKIVLADTGAGIAENMREDIFAPFVVGEQSRNKQGSGLGLAVCQKIITAHGGTITLNDSDIEGCRSQFEITLPLIKQ